MHVTLRTLSFEVDEDGEPIRRPLDLIPVNAARVSVNGESQDFTERDNGLLRRLITDRHGTPFEHGTIGFLVEVPIFVERQWRTHRWSSFNEHSGRYSLIEPKGYLPKVFHKQVGKAMDYQREDLTGNKDISALFSCDNSYQESWVTYCNLINIGVAREEARIVLPVGFYTKFYWTANLRSIVNFLSLRNDVHAQSQIREAAEKVETIFARFFPATHKAFIENDRQPIGA